MMRSVVFTCLLDILPTEFGRLEQAPRDLAGLVITEVCQIVAAEHPLDIYVTCQEYAARVADQDSEPGYLTRYAEGLLAKQLSPPCLDQSAAGTRPVRIELTAPHSEVCMHLRVAGTRVLVEPRPNGMAQLYTLAGETISFPITRGEAGLHPDENRAMSGLG